ncbi:MULTISPECIES: SIR2 family protein [unclassified Brevundimonas]|uniref:SIR2 family protein n=1 Tax=unclassified Brevundimonas TaxID=2622653 RepID=UPI0025C3351F|nr:MULTISPECIES: SIR2 family protein [unclassified Brevundimonas]
MAFWPDSLAREIADRRVLIFIGAGLSKSACPTLPTWPTLLTTLSERLGKQKDKILIKSLIKKGELLDAAQIIRDGVDGAVLSTDIRNKFQIRPTPYNDIYKHLLLLDPKTIVTTNYDEFVERNFEHFSGGTEAHSIVRHDGTHLLNDLRSPIRNIVKIHGCVSNPHDVVLDRTSYFEARKKNPSLFSLVSALMTVNTVLFLGYSVSDPDIRIILENINLVSKAENSHYALVSKFDHSSIKGALTSTYNIKYLEYPDGQHGLVPGLIKELAESVEAIRSSRGIV